MFGNHQEAIEKARLEPRRAVTKGDQELIEVCDENILPLGASSRLAPRETGLSRHHLAHDVAPLIGARDAHAIADDAEVSGVRGVLEAPAYSRLEQLAVDLHIDEPRGGPYDEAF
jgi:hypothetical protein